MLYLDLSFSHEFGNANLANVLVQYLETSAALSQGFLWPVRRHETHYRYRTRLVLGSANLYQNKFFPMTPRDSQTAVELDTISS